MKPYLFFMFLCALGNSLLAQNCNGNFQDHYSIFRSNGENFRQFADINNDQLTDLITQDNSTIAHFYINTCVGFTPAGSLQLPLFGNVVAVKDFDNDGYADLLSNSITGSTCLNNQIRIFWNTGSTGSNYNTGLSTNLPLPVNPYCMQSQDIDFDSDGLLDVIATSMPFGPGSNNPGRTYKNLGNRQFAVASDFLWPRDLYGTYTRDFDGDGNADFLVTVKDGWADGLRGMYYYRGNGNGTFQSPIINFNTAPLAAGGIPIQSDPQSNTTNDILMSLNGVSPSTVKLGRWNGTNNFSFDNITIPTGFAMGQAFDYNLDGVQDIMIFSTSTPSTIRTMYGAGNGTYTPDDSNLLQSDSFTLSTLFQDEDAPEQYITAYSNDSLKVYKRSSPELQVIQEEASICAGAAYNFNGTELTESGVYNQVLFQNAQGCDSVMISLSLNVLEPVSSEISVTLNEGEVYDFFGEQLTSAGQYIQTLQSASGCDSTVILTLTFETANNPCGSGLFEFNWMRIIDENSSRVGQLNGFITTNCSVYRNNWRNQIQPISINNNGKVCIQGVSSCDPILAALNTS
ncbi:MAG: FG-GAP repeat domain-containing protein, partial [Flavobacteriales bacterium]